MKLNKLLILAVLNLNLFAGFDTMNPIESMTHTQDIPSQTQDITLSWEQAIPNDSDELAGYYYILDTNSTTIMPNVVDTRSAMSSSALTIDVSAPNTNGDFYFHLAPYASSGNMGATLHFGPIKLDTVAPILDISPQSGSYNSIQTVSISMDDLNPALIYYTTDGSTPTPSSDVYSNAIGISQTTTLKVLAMDLSDHNTTTTEIYTINIDSNVANFGNEIADGSIISIQDVPLLSVVGVGLTHYKYKIDTASFSQQVEVSQAIDISNLSKANHTITIIGYDGSTWQSESSAVTLSFTVSDNPEDDTYDREKNILVQSGTIVESDTLISFVQSIIQNDGSEIKKITEQSTSSGNVLVQQIVATNGTIIPQMIVNGKLITLPEFPIGAKVYVVEKSDGTINMIIVSPLTQSIEF